MQERFYVRVNVLMTNPWVLPAVRPFLHKDYDFFYNNFMETSKKLLLTTYKHGEAMLSLVSCVGGPNMKNCTKPHKIQKKMKILTKFWWIPKKIAKKFCRKVLLQFFGIPIFLDLQIKVSVSLLLAIQSCCAMLVSPDTYYYKYPILLLWYPQ